MSIIETIKLKGSAERIGKVIKILKEVANEFEVELWEDHFSKEIFQDMKKAGRFYTLTKRGKIYYEEFNKAQKEIEKRLEERE
jgi:hypothetical protein